MMQSGERTPRPLMRRESLIEPAISNGYTQYDANGASILPIRLLEFDRSLSLRLARLVLQGRISMASGGARSI